MDLINRRLLVRAGLAGAATLAVAGMPRKPLAQTILTPKPDPEVKLLGITAMVPTNPPSPPASVEFTDADGKPVKLADFAGKGVLLNLWATWCTPCVAEMPALDAMAQKLAAEGIVVVPVSSDRGGAAVVRKFYLTHEIGHLGVWLDPKGVAARGWGARGLPTTIVIDRQGRERGRLEGGAEWNTDAALAEIRRLVA